MRVFLDTCVISELQRPKGNVRVRQVVAEMELDDLPLSVVTLDEVVNGNARLLEGHRKRALGAWYRELEQQFHESILPIELEGARIGGVTARAQAHGVQVPAADGLIAATARRHGLHVMTRNLRNFAVTGALVVDPWAE